MPPPLGDLTLAEVTPPGTTMSMTPQPRCDEAVPGFWATGTSPNSLEETRAWYEGRFGQVNEEVTARVNDQRLPDAEHTVYDDLRVSICAKGTGSSVSVST